MSALSFKSEDNFARRIITGLGIILIPPFLFQKKHYVDAKVTYLVHKGEALNHNLAEGYFLQVTFTELATGSNHSPNSQNASKGYVEVSQSFFQARPKYIYICYQKSRHSNKFLVRLAR